MSLPILGSRPWTNARRRRSWNLLPATKGWIGVTTAESDQEHSPAMSGRFLLFALLPGWGTNAPSLDLDGNGVVDGGDLGALLSDWGA